MKTEEKSMKNVEKVFTKEKRNNIIRKEYNPLTVNCKNHERGSGLFMKETKDIIPKEQMNELIISKKDFKEIFNSKKVISRGEYEEYLKNKNCT